jgi:hypothetical protein
MTLQERHMEHLKAWQASGLTQGGYCQQQGLNVKTFSRWFRAYRLSNQPTKPLLIPVKIKPAAVTSSTTASLWLRLPKGHALELPGNTSPRWLAELLQCLG